MDLTRVVAAAARHKWIIAIGVLAGLALGFLSLYRVSMSDAQSGRSAGVEKRGVSQYQAEALLVIDTAGLGIGRADVPGQRANEVAPVYAYLAASDSVMRAVRQQVGSPLEVEVMAEQVPNSPVIKLMASGTDAERVREVTNATAQEFITYLTAQQEKNGIPEAQRMVVRYVNTPKVTQLKTRQTEMAFLALLLPIIGSFGVALAVENVMVDRSVVTIGDANQAPPTQTPPASDPASAAKAAPTAQPRQDGRAEAAAWRAD